MRLTEYLKVDGVLLPTPYKCSVTEYDIDDAASGRSESGDMNRDRVRAKVARYDLEFVNLSAREAKLIRNLIMPVYFNCELRFLGDNSMRTMYAGDLKWTERLDDAKVSHIGLTCSFIEK